MDRCVCKQPKACWIKSFKVLAFVIVYYGNNVIFFWNQNHTVTEIYIQKGLENNPHLTRVFLCHPSYSLFN